MLGGRAAEEVVYDGIVSTGAANDLERASELARQLVIRYGMSERLGLMTYVKSHGPRHIGSGTEERSYSESTAEAIDQESRRIIDTIYARVRGILREHRDQLQKVASELIARETLMREELLGLLGRRPTETASVPPSSASTGA